MKKIIINTDVKCFYSDFILKPSAPVFEFTNIGGLPVYVNGNFRLMPQQSFGINLQSLCARFIDRGYTIECNNEFEITWTRPQTQLETGLDAVFYAIYLVLYYLSRRIGYTHTTFTTQS